MTVLTVKSCISFLTEVEGVTWRQEDYNASKIKKIIKGEDINGFVNVKIGGGSRRFNNTNKEDFLPAAYATMANKIAQEVEGEFSIIPIPNSVATVADREDFRTAMMARAIAERIGERASVVPALRWKAAHDPAHKIGGPRDPQIHFANLVKVEEVEGRVVLFDDVLTTGSQMIGATRRLARSAIRPELGFTICRAVKEQLPKMLGWVDTNLQVDSTLVDWEALF